LFLIFIKIIYMKLQQTKWIIIAATLLLFVGSSFAQNTPRTKKKNPANTNNTPQQQNSNYGNSNYGDTTAKGNTPQQQNSNYGAANNAAAPANNRRDTLPLTVVKG